MKAVFKVLGAKKFKGDVEGQSFDSCKVYVVMEVSERNGTEVGFNAVPLPYGKSENFEAIKAFPYPCDLELDIAMTTKGYELLSAKLPGKNAGS